MIKYPFSQLMIMLIITFLSCGCGIDTLDINLDSDYLPIATSSSNNSLTFQGPVETEYPYLGIVLFYRIYASTTKAGQDKSLLIQEQSTTALPGNAITFLENSLKYARPIRVDTSSSIITPTIYKDLVTNYISINLVDGLIELSFAETNQVQELLRNTDSGNKQFNDNLGLETSDYDSSEMDDSSNVLCVQWFAASYGFDIIGLNPKELYSDLVYLGLIILNNEG